MALPFIDENFPSNFTIGLQDAIFFNDVTITTPAGISDIYELGPNWGRLRYIFDASQMEIDNGNEILELKEFYIANKRNSFRLNDPIENTVTSENFATGDGSTVAFQLYINYGDIERPITKPIDNASFKIYDNAVEQTESVDYTVDYDTGIVTFTVAPIASNPLTWDGDFDIHVRFDNNTMNAAITGLRRGNFNGIGLVEEVTV